METNVSTCNLANRVKDTLPWLRFRSKLPDYGDQASDTKMNNSATLLHVSEPDMSDSASFLKLLDDSTTVFYGSKSEMSDSTTLLKPAIRT